MNRILYILFFLLLYFQSFAQPANDDCSNATPIVISNGNFDLGTFTSTTVDITDATKQIGETFHNVQISAGNDKKTVWYSFTIPTARAINVELLQPTENIAQNGVGFTLFKSNTCLPDLDDITAAKLTPLNKFGSSYNPCLLPGDYLIQVSAKNESDGDIYVEVTVGLPDVLNDYFIQTNAYDFGTISGGWHRESFDIGCQIIEDATETCSALGGDYLDYTQTAWFTFTTDADVDLVSLRMGEQSGYFTGNFKIGYNLYTGDVSTTPYTSLTLADGCQVMEYTTENDYPIRNYLCDLSPNTTYSIQVFFHSEYTNSIFIELLEKGEGATISPDPSNIQPVSELGILASSSTGEWTYGYDYLSCNAFIADNACGSVNPSGGLLDNYSLSTFYTFELDDYMNLNILTSSYLGKKLYFGDVQTDCNLSPIYEFTSNNQSCNCLEPGTYTLQILGKIDTSQSHINSTYYNHIGAAANISIETITNSINSNFLLDATGKIDTVNLISNSWEPLPDDISISSSTGRFNCSNTVLPDGDVCSANTNRAMYREIIIGDADGDGSDDSGVLTLSNGNYYFRYSFYKGSSTELATAQGTYNAGETFTGLEEFTLCNSLYYSNPKVCVEPGKYTLITFGEDVDVGRTDNPFFKFNIRSSLFDDPNAPNNMGDISAALQSGNVQGTPDYFSCLDNPLTIATKAPCSGATKQIYREFYIDQETILNITQSGANSFRIFYGKISDGVSGLSFNIPGIGDIGCRSSYYSNVCNPLPSGWYTIVSYGIGANYSSPDYSGGVIGNQTNINIARVEPLAPVNYNLPYLAYDAGVTDWGPNMGTSATPQNSQTYTFGTETFNCNNDLPLLVNDCNNKNRQAFYVFEITDESYLSFSGIPTSMKAMIFEGDVRSDSANFANNTAIEVQECINISNINHYDRSYWLWNGRIDLCKMQPGIYTLIVLANDNNINQSVTPVLYVDNVSDSRFDFAQNAYDFGDIETTNTFQYGKTGDTNPLNSDRAASNDFFSCSTGAFTSDPGQSDPIEYCWDGMYPMDGESSVDYPMDDNFAQYESSTISPVRRNLWYTFVIDGPGLVSIKIENKTPGKTLQNPFAIYKSDVDGNLDFSSIQSSNDVDSTINQGLGFIANNSTFGWGGCAGNRETVSFNIDPCDNPGKQRFYIVVDQHVGIIPNSQIEVSIKHNAIVSLESNYDYFSEANVINGLNEGQAPYTNVQLTDGVYSGDTSSFACATKATSDQNSCGTRTLWYKFDSGIDGELRILYDIVGDASYYNNNEMMLFKEVIIGDSTNTGLELISTSNVNISGQIWGESCLNKATYYVMLTGCSYTVENVSPRIWLISEDGGNCEQSVPIVMASFGTASESVTVDCHNIGGSFGEDGSNMGCLNGPNGYKSSWFKVDLNFTERADLTFQLSENTTALPSQIRYRVLYGTCNAMTAGPCNTDASTEFTLNCMMSENSSYFVQVVMPENTTGEITLTVTAEESPNQTCEPFDPLAPTANFTYNNPCSGDETCFDNQSSLGDSLIYNWTFDLGNSASDTSTEINPCYIFASEGTYDVQLIVTNTETGLADTVVTTVTIYLRPDPNITRDPSDNLIIIDASTDFYSNVNNTVASPPTTYQWDMSNGSTETTSDVTGVIYTDANIGENIVYVTVTNGECIIIDADTFNVGYEPIYSGGFYDGSSANFQGCPTENVFAGGFYDGSNANYQGCPTENVYAGGFYDGSDANYQGCPTENIYTGGFYDGSDANYQGCPTENIYTGGFFDGSAVIIKTGDIDIQALNNEICSGDDLQINVNESDPIDTIYWYKNDQLISTMTSSPFDLTYALDTSATIKAIVIFQSGACKSIQNFNITVIYPSLTGADAGIDQTICLGESVQIGTPAINDTVQFVWSPTNSLDNAFIDMPYASPTNTTTYYLTVSEVSDACPSYTDNMLVTVITDIPVLTVNNEQLCLGESENITVSGTEASDAINWYTNTNTGLGTTNTISVNTADTYYVEVTRGNCSTLDSSVVTVSDPYATKLAWRSKQTGNWNDVNSWQVNDGSSWVDANTYTNSCGSAVTYPTYLDSTILIQNTHTISYNLASISVDELSIENGATLILKAGDILQMVDSSSSINIPDILNNGIMTIENTGTLSGIGNSLIQNNGRINIAGTFDIAGSSSPQLINSDASTVAYTNADQNMWSGSYGRLEISGTGNKSVTATSTYIKTEVEFIDGYILLGYRNIMLAQAAIVTNASYNTGFFITNSMGTVIKKSLGSSGYESFVFPIGTSSTSFNKAKVTNTGTSDDIRCRVSDSFDFDAVFSNDELIEDESVNRTWYLSEAIDGGSDIKLELFWKSEHENTNFDRTDCQLGSYNNSDGWNRIGLQDAATGSDTWTDMYTHFATNITSLNAFSIGSCNLAPMAYRTIADGNWTDISVWEVLDNSGVWVSPQSISSACGLIDYPTSYSEEITVRHNITYDLSIPQGIDQVTIEPQSVLTITSGINLLIANGTGVDIDNSGQIIVTGNISGESNFEISNQTGSLFNYNGGNQTLLDCNYAQLKVDGNLANAGNIKSVIGSNTKVNESLTFTNAKIKLDSNLTMGVDAVIENPSQNTGYFKALDLGYLIRGYNTGNTISRIFPVGGQYYSPATLTFDSVAVAGNMSCRVREDVHPQNSSSISRYWCINKTALEFEGTFDLNLKYNQNDLPSIPTSMSQELEMVDKAGAYDIDYATADHWIYYPQGSEYYVDVDNNSATMTHNHFSDFTLLSQDNALPVTLLYLSAKWNNNNSILTWATASEINNSGFEIQRCSGHCDNFETIGFIEGHGNSNKINLYQFIDKNIKLHSEDNFYYRLKQIDYDHKAVYSYVVNLSKSENDKKQIEQNRIFLYPNPAIISKKRYVVIESSEEQEVEINVRDVIGKELFRDYKLLKEGENIYVLDTDRFLEGTYILSIRFDEKVINIKFIVIE